MLDYEGGGELEFVGGPALALLGLGVDAIAQAQARGAWFIPSAPSEPRWPDLPSQLQSTQVQLRGKLLGTNGTGTLDPTEAASTGSTGASLSGQYPAVGSTATVSMPVMALTAGTPSINVISAQATSSNATTPWPANVPVPPPRLPFISRADTSWFHGVYTQRLYASGGMDREGSHAPYAPTAVAAAGVMMDARPLRLAVGLENDLPDTTRIDVHW